MRIPKRTTRAVWMLCAFVIASSFGSARGQSALAEPIVHLSDASRRLDDYVGKECAGATSPAVQDTRTQGAAALYDLLYRNDTETAQRLLDREWAVQIVDRESQRYGAVVNPATPLDPNDTVFAAQPWGPILLRYADRLKPDGRAALRDHSRAALAYFERHPISVDYTNIHLLTSAEEVVLGDALADGNATRLGMDGLRNWVASVRRDGIHEFESPTYYAVDIDALELGAIFATDAEQRQAFAGALNYVWREIAANLFTPKHRIAGAQSRSYDMLYGSDTPMEMKLRYEGLDGDVHDPSALRCLDIFSVLQDLGSYHMPEDARALADKTPRRVRQRYAGDAQSTKVTYVTDRFAIGSSNTDYDQTDRVAAIDFSAGPAHLAPIRVLADKTGYWYGPSPTNQLDGERKWDHVLVRPTTVQSDNFLLVLCDPDGSVANDGGPLTVDVLLPATDDTISIGARTVSIDASLDEPLTTAQAVSVRVGDTTAAIRLLRADDAGGGPAPLALTTDPAGFKAGVVRMRALQARALPTAAKDLRSAILFGVASGSDGASIARTIEDAHVLSSDVGPYWNVDVTVGGHLLAVTYDRRTHRSHVRKIDDVTQSSPDPLSVDGVAIHP